MYDVITMGSATLDTFIDTRSELLTMDSPGRKEKHICYPSGEKIVVKNILLLPGGGGVNTAISFARLGLKTAYLGNLGQDDNASAVIKHLRSEKIGFIGTRGKEPTNFSIILDSIEHDRTILVHRAASDMLSYNKIDKKKLKTKWFYLSSLMGTSFKSALKILSHAKKNKMHTASNISLYLAEQGAKKLKPFLEKLDVLIYNKEEAQEMLRTKTSDVKKLLELTRSTGPKIVVITDGKDGAHASDGIYHYYIPASKVKVVESTGAGDAFASAFVAGLAKGKDVEFSMMLGLAQSQSVIRYVGAQNKLLSWNAALKDIKAYKLKVQKKRL